MGLWFPTIWLTPYIFSTILRSGSSLSGTYLQIQIYFLRSNHLCNSWIANRMIFQIKIITTTGIPKISCLKKPLLFVAFQSACHCLHPGCTSPWLKLTGVDRRPPFRWCVTTSSATGTPPGRCTGTAHSGPCHGSTEKKGSSTKSGLACKYTLTIISFFFLVAAPRSDKNQRLGWAPDT